MRAEKAVRAPFRMCGSVQTLVPSGGSLHYRCAGSAQIPAAIATVSAIDYGVGGLGLRRMRDRGVHIVRPAFNCYGADALMRI